MTELDTRKLKIVPEDQIVHKSENDAFIKKILEILLEKDRKHDQKLEALSQAFRQLMTDLRNQVDGLFVSDRVKKLENSHNDKMKGIDDKLANLDEKMNSVDKRMAKVKSGYTPVKGKDYFDGAHAEPPSVEMIQEALKQPIEEFTKNWDDKVQALISSKRMAGGTPHNLLQTIDVSSQIDGTNRTFTSLPTARHYPMIYSSQAPFVLIPNIHYTIGRKSITITNNIDAPQSGTGQFLVVCYIK